MAKDDTPIIVLNRHHWRSREELIALLRVSESTFHRRLKKGEVEKKLGEHESFLYRVRPQADETDARGAHARGAHAETDARVDHATESSGLAQLVSLLVSEREHSRELEAKVRELEATIRGLEEELRQAGRFAPVRPSGETHPKVAWCDWTSLRTTIGAITAP